jgi:hypothetical protein
MMTEQELKQFVGDATEHVKALYEMRNEYCTTYKSSILIGIDIDQIFFKESYPSVQVPNEVFEALAQVNSSTINIEDPHSAPEELPYVFKYLYFINDGVAFLTVVYERDELWEKYIGG